MNSAVRIFNYKPLLSALHKRIDMVSRWLYIQVPYARHADVHSRRLLDLRSRGWGQKRMEMCDKSDNIRLDYR